MSATSDNEKTTANLNNNTSSLPAAASEKLENSVGDKKIEVSDNKIDITAATDKNVHAESDIKKINGDHTNASEAASIGDSDKRNLLKQLKNDETQQSNGKMASEEKASGDKKEEAGGEKILSTSPAKDNNNNKDLSANPSLTEKSSEKKNEDETTTKSSATSAASNEKRGSASYHTPLTASHSQLSANAAPFVENAGSMNFKNASKPRPLRMPLNANIPFAPGHAQLGYSHQYLGPQHHFTGSFHAQHHQQQQTGVGPQHQQLHQNHSQPHESVLTTDEALEFMENINRSVKANQFSPSLSNQISRLYNFLKMNGEAMEQSHKNELNRVFVSLRQACCRDSGQLGTPCRLKMMELVELRAMGWRPSLSHSQYYLNRATNGFPRKQSLGVTSSGSSPGTGGTDGGSGGGQDFSPHSGDTVSPVEVERLGATPVSAPPYGHLNVNPFTFNLPGPVPPEMISQNPALAGPAPSYYLIPASHIGHPPAGLFVGPTGAGGGPGLLPAPPPPLMAHQAAAAAAAAAAAHHHPLTSTFSTPAGLPSMSSSSSSEFPKGAVTKSSTKFSRPTKIPGKNQFRDEVVIRNADSGKIMGVKGRRVSIIEEISKTIISFQKVMQGAKERTLTITGPNEESILQAKILIEDTIRRNVSPAREGEGELPLRHDLDGLSNNSEESDLAGLGENGGEQQSTETECALAEMGSILKLSCANPAVLQVARRALNEYFHRHEPVLRRSSTADAYRYMSSGGGSGISYGKERRKSMPLPLHALSNVTETSELETLTPKTPVEKDAPTSENGSLSNVSKLNRSTPNLADDRRRSILKPLRSFTFDEDKPLVFDENRPRVVYTREFLLQCAAHDASKTHPNILPSIAEQINEIVSPNLEKFDPLIYKRRCSDLKQVRF